MLRYLSRYSSKVLPVQYQSYALFATKHSKKVAVVLSGSGVYDGTEIHEAAAVLAHLTREGVEPVCFAPDIPQLHIVNHIKGEPTEKEARNVLVESARIARGNVQPLSALEVSSTDAVVFPGGFGAAKNLSTFAVKGVDCEVDSEVARVLTQFHKAKKPIALCCIAPVLAAKVLGKVTITLGQEDSSSGKWPYSGTIEQARLLGANVECKDVNDVSYDAKNLIVTTPAFMYDGKFHEISDGIGLMIKKLISLLR